MPILLSRTRALASMLLLALALVAAPSAAAAPTIAFDSFVEETNPQYQHAIGNVMYFNAAQAGSFTLRMNASDPDDGIDRVDFPGLGSGWTPVGTSSDNVGPTYEVTYGWSAAASVPSVQMAIAYSLAATTATASFTVVSDLSAPVGGSIAYINGFTNAGVPLTIVAPTDAQSGVAALQVERRSGNLTGSTCGTYGAWSAIGPANPGPTWTDTTVVDGRCYQYRVVATDHVGNARLLTSPNTVKVDQTAPTGTINSAPPSPFVGSVQVDGTAADTKSGVSSVAITWDGPSGTGDICLSPPSPHAWSCTWHTLALTPGVYTIQLEVTDTAGNVSAPITRVVTVEAPTSLVDLDTAAGTEVAEGSAGVVLAIALTAMPADDVDISLDGGTQLATSVPAITFTPGNWNVPQLVTVSAVDDVFAELPVHVGQVSLTITSDDPAFDGALVAPALYDIVDNDLANVLVNPNTLTLDEAGPANSDTVDVVLTSEPTADVTLTLANVDGQVEPDVTTLTFTPLTWNTPQQVTVTAIDDLVDEIPDEHAGTITFQVSSIDLDYDVLDVADLLVTIHDDEFVLTGSATASFGAFTELVNPQYQHAAGNTLWFNPAQSGSFTATGTGVGVPDLASLAFPALGAGWTPATATVDATPPYTGTYSWSPGAAAPGVAVLTATGTGGMTGTDTFTVAADATPPTGTTVIAQTATTRDTSAPVSGTVGTDAQSGISHDHYERRLAPLSADTCGTYGPWGQVGPTSPAGPITDTSLVDSTCIQYRHVTTDNVGNVDIAEQDGQLKVDRTAPLASIDPIAGPLWGTVTITGTAVDATTRVKSVTVLAEDRYSICPSVPLDASGRWSCTWRIGYDEVGPASVRVTVTDQVGLRTSVAQNVTLVKEPSPFGPREEDIDRTPPVVGLARIPLVSWSEGVRVKASAFDDRPGTLEIRVEQRSARANSTRWSQWAESFEESEITPLEERGETTCFRGVAIDEAGNKAYSAQRCTTVPLDDSDLRASRHWDDMLSRANWLGTYRMARARGATLSTVVADPTPAIVVTKCPRCGIIRVYHGKRVLGTYSLAARRTVRRAIIQLKPIRNVHRAQLRIVTLNARPVIVDGMILAR